MCRNIKPLFNFDPPATSDEINDAALQFVRKVSGSRRPSRQNEVAFDRAVSEVADSVQRLLGTLETTRPTRNREIEAAKARARSAARFS